MGELSDEDIYFEIAAAMSMMGDIHSMAIPNDSLYERYFPVAVEYFGDKLYLIACLDDCEPLEPYLLHEIVAVNGVDITYIEQYMERIGNPFNQWLSRAYWEETYFIPAFFDWAGCDYREGYTFQILNDNREVASVEIPVIAVEQVKDHTWICPENWDALFYRKGGNWTAYFDGEKDGYVYMSLAQLMSKSDVQRQIREAGELLAAHPDCGKLVIDLRKCPGGNAEYLACFQEDAARVLDRADAYVLTGGMTASAATVFMAYFKDQMGAVIVGEPTGQFQSMFHLMSTQDGRSVLPHSQISIILSNGWWDGPSKIEEKWDGVPIADEYYGENGRLYAWESMILPDVFVYQDIEDIRQGKDSVIEWVLDQ